MADLQRGEVWLADLDPVRGHEQGGRRPVLVLSDNRYNRGPADLANVLPITSRLRGIAYHVRVRPPDGGLSRESEILCDRHPLGGKGALHRALGATLRRKAG
ncbi:MAG TPA: type II toxin-antitoxin system PemK/MazF family toxin [Dehalococcoidia bacterium]|nr:type II toxin-antitoxin system PemK/MazF family toxin [Dehalococcoidia bacterium]